MKYNLKELKKKAYEASELINQKIPTSKVAFDIVSQSIVDSTEVTKKALYDVTARTQGIIQTTMEDERTKELMKTISSTTETTTKELKKYTEKAVDTLDGIKDKTISLENLDETDSVKNIKQTIQKLKGKDKIGVIGEGLATAGGATAGVAATGSIASAAGATTLLGSTSLAGTLGGIFVTTTPVGWIIGSAVIAGAAGYSIAKMVRSGSEQDQVRKEIIQRLSERLNLMCSQQSNKSSVNSLNQVLPIAIMNGLIGEGQADKMLSLIESGALNVDVAVHRIESMILASESRGNTLP